MTGLPGLLGDWGGEGAFQAFRIFLIIQTFQNTRKCKMKNFQLFFCISLALHYLCHAKR